MSTKTNNQLEVKPEVLDIFGSRLHYWTYHPEQERVIVMIHGYRGTHHGLLDIIAQLPQFKFIIPDLPGFGQSTPMTRRAHNIAGYAALFRHLIHELEYKQVILLGHSMGTVIAADIATHEPELVSKIIMVNPIADLPFEGMGAVRMAPGILYHWLGAEALPENMGNQLLSSRLLFLIGSASMTKTKNRPLRKKIHASHMLHMAKYQNRATLLEAYKASISATVTERAQHVKVPTLLVAGQADAIAPIKGARKLAAALPQGTLVELPDVGHIIHFEKPTETAVAIIEFLG